MIPKITDTGQKIAEEHNNLGLERSANNEPRHFEEYWQLKYLLNNRKCFNSRVSQKLDYHAVSTNF